MKYLSTRQGAPAAGFSTAMDHGLAPDGGLYVPEAFPVFSMHHFAAEFSLPELAERLLSPYLEGDPLQAHLKKICKAAFDFEIVLKNLKNQTALLELFHGPTAAFKDIGARFLAECLSRLPVSGARDRLVLVATSGDTGGAVAAAFHRRPGFEVAILFPKGKISPRQQQQLTCWGENIRAYAVAGNFDDCQRLVKAAFADKTLRARRPLLSANSINIGRLLPQQVYYAWAALAYRRQFHQNAGFVVPTGNLGNAVASLWTQRIGFPIASVALATNANQSILDYFRTGEWQPKETVSTLANAMDVGNPSNMERLIHLYPNLKDLKRDVRVFSVSDREISQTIELGPSEYNEVWCPHTATAVAARKQLASPQWVIVATASPAKFDTIVEPLIGRKVAIPPALAALLTRASNVIEISSEVGELEKIIG